MKLTSKLANLSFIGLNRLLTLADEETSTSLWSQCLAILDTDQMLVAGCVLVFFASRVHSWNISFFLCLQCTNMWFGVLLFSVTIFVSNCILKIIISNHCFYPKPYRLQNWCIVLTMTDFWAKYLSSHSFFSLHAS